MDKMGAYQPPEKYKNYFTSDIKAVEKSCILRTESLDITRADISQA